MCTSCLASPRLAGCVALQDCEGSPSPTKKQAGGQATQPKGAVRRKPPAGGGGGINRRKQGGEEYLAQVGALAVPEHARQRQRGAGGALAQVNQRALIEPKRGLNSHRLLSVFRHAMPCLCLVCTTVPPAIR